MASVWTNHFMNMAKGNVPVSDFYTVTREGLQSGKGVVLVTPTEAVKKRAAARLKKAYKRKRGCKVNKNSRSRKVTKKRPKKRTPSKKRSVKRRKTSKRSWLPQ